jgi:predicted nucleic acid-binding protein
MKLLIDANILLDVLQRREPHYSDSELLWKLCETGQVRGYISALTVANLVYIMRKELTAERIEEVLSYLMLIFHLTELTESDIMHAAKKQWANFEDAIQSASAERIHADYIVTRNVKDFKNSKVAALAPGEFLARL